MNNKIKLKLQSNELTIGSWITLPCTAIAEIMCNAGFDWLVVDLEHSTISIESAGEIIRTIELSGTNSLVRLTSNNANQIKRVLDAGAHGIVVPKVNSAKEAKLAVNATRYGPEGGRGVGLARAQQYGAEFNEYLDWQSNNVVVIAQIEHIDALENLKEIITTDGIDGVIIGPYDLSCSMGIPGEFDRQDFKETMTIILKTCQDLNFPCGIHVVEPNLNEFRTAVNNGYKFIAYSVDTRMLDFMSRKAVEKLQEIKG